MAGIDVIILAGGLGTRLRSELPDTPKVLAPVNGRPFLDIPLNRLARWGGTEKVTLAVGYKAEAVMREYADNHSYPFSITFAREDEPLGTGGGVKNALPRCDTDTVMVMNGDSFVDADLQAFTDDHRSSGAAASMVLRRVENANRYGLVGTDENGWLTSFKEKEPGDREGLINAGVYLFSKTLFDSVPENRVISLEKDLLPRFVTEGVKGFITEGKFIDIGLPETYRAAEAFFKE